MLTVKQKVLLDFLSARAPETVSPSFEEMAAAIGAKSKSNIFRLLNGLEERGFIRRLKNRSRAVEVIKAAGTPLAELDACIADIASSGYKDVERYEAAMAALVRLAVSNGLTVQRKDKLRRQYAG